MEKIETSCPDCDAYYTINHDMGSPYVLNFCAFCGYEMEEDDYDMDIYENEYE